MQTSYQKDDLSMKSVASKNQRLSPTTAADPLSFWENIKRRGYTELLFLSDASHESWEEGARGSPRPPAKRTPTYAHPPQKTLFNPPPLHPHPSAAATVTFQRDAQNPVCNAYIRILDYLRTWQFLLPSIYDITVGLGGSPKLLS